MLVQVRKSATRGSWGHKYLAVTNFRIKLIVSHDTVV
jgi:hypothetical protein